MCICYRILSSISWSVYQTNWTRVSSSWLVVWTLTGFIEELRQCQCQCNTYGIYMYCHPIIMSNVTVIVYCALGWKQLYCSIQKVFGILLCHCITYLQRAGTKSFNTFESIVVCLLCLSCHYLYHFCLVLLVLVVVLYF